jgi:acylphosphatase
LALGIGSKAAGWGRAWPGAMLVAMKTVRLRIAGQVHGVGYRAWAMRLAAELGLRGWVRNRRDGTVEMLVTGSAAGVAAIIAAAGRGPPTARVSDVSAVEDQDDGSLGFATLPTI